MGNDGNVVNIYFYFMLLSSGMFDEVNHVSGCSIMKEDSQLLSKTFMKLINNVNHIFPSPHDVWSVKQHDSDKT